MALIKCTECGGTVSDKATTCPHCGAPVEVPQEESTYETNTDESVSEADAPSNEAESTASQAQAERPKPSKKKVAIIAAVIAAVIIAAIIGFVVTRDKEAPVISGIEKGQTIDVTCGTAFNLKDYIDKDIKITDNKDGEITEYTVKAKKGIYNSKTGEVNTQEFGEFPVTIITQDKAENTTELKCTLKLNPVHITKKNKTPVVYDGEFAKIKLVSFKRGFIDGENQYQMIFEFTNKWDNDLEVYLLSTYTYIKDTHVTAYHTVGQQLKPGKNGKSECNIYINDIPKDIGDYDRIESAIGMGYPDADAEIAIPIVFDTNAADKQ